MASAERLARMNRRHRPSTPTYDGPVGLVHAGDPDAAARDGYVMATAVAAAMKPGATVERVVESVLARLDCLDSLDPRYGGEFEGRLKRLLKIAEEAEDVFSLREPVYREILVTYPPWTMNGILEMVPLALAICVAARGDPETAIVGAANMGRDADTIGSFVGEIVGALSGWEAFPRQWTERVETLNPEPDMRRIAEELCALIRDRAEEDLRRSSELLAMLS